MSTREEMIEKLGKMEGIHAEYVGTCVAGFDVEVASKHGAGTACCQAGSSDVMGPVQLSEDVRDFIVKGGTNESDDEERDEEEDPLAGVDDDEVQVLEQMVARKCQTDTDHYYFFMGESADTIHLGTDEDEVRERWAEWAFEGTELTAWEDMEDEELEGWFDRLDA